MRQKLNERLHAVNGTKTGYLPAFYIFMDEYFNTLSKMCGSEYYLSLYTGRLKKFDCWDGKGHVLAMVIPTSLLDESITPQDRMELLYRVLVEPFCDSEIWEKKGEEHTCNPI